MAKGGGRGSGGGVTIGVGRGGRCFPRGLVVPTLAAERTIVSAASRSGAAMTINVIGWL